MRALSQVKRTAEQTHQLLCREGSERTERTTSCGSVNSPEEHGGTPSCLPSIHPPLLAYKQNPYFLGGWQCTQLKLYSSQLPPEKGGQRTLLANEIWVETVGRDFGERSLKGEKLTQVAHVFGPFPPSCLQGSGAREMYQFPIASVTMTTNTVAYNNVNFLSYISLGQKSDMSVIRKIKGLAELCSFLEDLRVNPCPCLFQLPEATHIPGLMAPCLHLRNHQRYISPTALSQSHLPLTLFSDSLFYF